MYFHYEYGALTDAVKQLKDALDRFDGLTEDQKADVNTRIKVARYKIYDAVEMIDRETSR